MQDQSSISVLKTLPSFKPIESALKTSSTFRISQQSSSAWSKREA